MIDIKYKTVYNCFSRPAASRPFEGKTHENSSPVHLDRVGRTCNILVTSEFQSGPRHPQNREIATEIEPASRNIKIAPTTPLPYAYTGSKPALHRPRRQNFSSMSYPAVDSGSGTAFDLTLLSALTCLRPTFCCAIRVVNYLYFGDERSESYLEDQRLERRQRSRTLTS